VVTATAVNALTDVLIGGSSNSFTGPLLYAGSNLTYQVFVANNGPSTAGSVFVTNLIPPGASVVSAVSTLGTCAQFPGFVTCSLGSLTSNQSATITVVTKPGLAGLATNRAVIVSSAADPNLLNNTSSAVSLVTPAADVALSVAGPVGQVVVTSNLVYSLTVSNRGPTFATNVMLTATLPPNTLFLLGAPASQGTTQLVGNVFTANLGSLNPSSVATVALTLRPMLEGVITTPVAVTSGVFDPIAANNSLNLTTTITNHPGGPILRIALAGTNVVLYWTTNSAGYALYSKPDELIGSSWRSVTNLPVVRGTQYFITNAMAYNRLSSLSSGSYYRLQRTIITPALTIKLSGTNVTLSWPVVFASYSLQRTFEFQASNNWTTITNPPLLQTGRYYLNDPLVGPQNFYRLNPP